ncbi:MAG: biotin/lipoyl-containing protein, partial [Chitinophagaceae bacterium]
LVKWLKKDGEYVERDQVIAELESEKATFEINAEKAGVLKTVAAEGDTLKIGDLAAQIDETAAAPAVAKVEEKKVEVGSAKVEEKPAVVETETKPVAVVDVKATPVAAAILADKKVDVKAITPSGSGGRIMKNDVLNALNNPGRKPGLEAFSRNDRNEKMSNLRRTIS